MRIAVTGATGFIGRHLIAELVQGAHEIIAVSRNAPATFLESKKTSWVKLDVASPPERAFESMGRPDMLVHLAWGGLPNYRSHHHFVDELPNHFRFLSQLVESGLQSLVVAGTCLEYGMQSGPLSEEMETRPIIPYGFAKDCLHRQLLFLKAVRPFSLTWARFFYLFGEGQKESSLYPQIKRAAEKREAVFPMSGGDQIRDYLPVSEAARLLTNLISLNQDIGTVNVCSGKPVTLRDIVACWKRKNNWSIQFEYGRLPYLDYEPMFFWGKCNKLTARLSLKHIGTNST